MSKTIRVFSLTKRLMDIYRRKGLLNCYNSRCSRGALKIGELVVSRLVSSGYHGKFRIAEKCTQIAKLEPEQRTRRVLYHYNCAEELNII